VTRRELRDQVIAITVTGGFEVIAYDTRVHPVNLLLGVAVQVGESVEDAVDDVLRVVRTALLDTIEFDRLTR
jgi:hypothetical protein